jgi:predicted metal-dependent peptidase
MSRVPYLIAAFPGYSDAQVIKVAIVLVRSGALEDEQNAALSEVQARGLYDTFQTRLDYANSYQPTPS